MRRHRVLIAPLVVCATLSGSAPRACGETMSGALSAAYRSDPDLAQERAATRAADEEVAKAKSEYRPKVNAAADVGYRYTNAKNGERNRDTTGFSAPNGTGLTVRQMVFDGNRTTSTVSRSESQLFLSREQLRDKEQQTLLAAATAYMDVLRDTAILDVRKNNVDVLIVRLREARARFAVREVTFTDVAEVASSLASGRSRYFTAQGNLVTSIAAYRRIVGTQPRRLEAARPVDRFLPSGPEAAATQALAEHPRVHQALQGVDVAVLEVRLAESRLYPTVDVVGRIRRSDAENGTTSRNLFETGAEANVAMPFYTGGADYASIRQAKETVAQARLKVEAARLEVRALVDSTWGQFQASAKLIRSASAAVDAAESAFIDVREEAKLGQRTTLNMLEALQTLLEARISLISAQRDRVVGSYAVLAAVGRLSATTLGLDGPRYDPAIHYRQVKDKWVGLRTPDGR